MCKQRERKDFTSDKEINVNKPTKTRRLVDI